MALGYPSASLLCFLSLADYPINLNFNYDASVIIDLRSDTIEAIQNGNDEKSHLLTQDIENAEHNLISLLKNYEDEKDHRGQVSTFDPIDALEIDKLGEGGFTHTFSCECL